MAKFSPTEAVFAGFRFARGRPATLLIWSAYLLVVTAVASIALFDLGGDSMTSLVIASQGANPDPAQLMKLMQDVLPASMFAGLLMVVFGAVLMTAILRVRLDQGVHPWGGLRFGGEELRLLGATALVAVAVLTAEILIGTLAGLVATAGVPPLLVLIPGFLLILALEVRLSLVWVISLAEGRISLARSWALTGKGFWRLTGAYVLLLAVVLVILFLLAIVFAALMGAAAVAMGGGVNQLALALQHNFADLNPVLLTLYILSNLAQVWLAVVFLTVALAISTEAYKAFLSEGPKG